MRNTDTERAAFDITALRFSLVAGEMRFNVQRMPVILVLISIKTLWKVTLWHLKFPFQEAGLKPHSSARPGSANWLVFCLALTNRT